MPPCRQKIAALQELLNLSTAQVSKYFGVLATLFGLDMDKAAARFAFLLVLTGECSHRQTVLPSA